VVNGKLNRAGMVALKEQFKHADWSKFEQDPDVSKILDVFTVGTIVDFVQRKLETSG
jgi:hypothetical protein